jgi:hypothetical protein
MEKTDSFYSIDCIVCKENMWVRTFEVAGIKFCHKDCMEKIKSVKDIREKTSEKHQAI